MTVYTQCVVCENMASVNEPNCKVLDIGGFICSESCLEDYQKDCPHEEDWVEEFEGVIYCTECEKVLAQITDGLDV